MVYSVTKYGAVGDGATNDAAAIQSAIDACNAAGGGRVVLEGGHTYYSSSIELKSNVELLPPSHHGVCGALQPHLVP